MDEVLVLFKKLTALKNHIKSMLDEKVGGGILIRYFRAESVEEIYPKYSTIIQLLKIKYPQLYNDFTPRNLPKPSEGGSYVRSFVEKLNRDVDYLLDLFPNGSKDEQIRSNLPNRIFITHGSSSEWMKIQNYLEKELKIDTIELAQEVNLGRTILQKLDEESDKSSYAVVVMTGDDIFSQEEIRARQNVIHEIGFFQGKYGIDRICLLYEENVVIPTNIQGLVYISFPKGSIEATFIKLSKEIKSFFKSEEHF